MSAVDGYHMFINVLGVNYVMLYMQRVASLRSLTPFYFIYKKYICESPIAETCVENIFHAFQFTIHRERFSDALDSYLT